MIKVWCYNELAADVDTNDTSLDLHFPIPTTVSRYHKMLVNNELVSSDTWTDVSGLTPATADNLVRSIDGTNLGRHKKNDAVWVESTPAELDDEPGLSDNPLTNWVSTIQTVNAALHDGYGGFFITGSFTTLGGKSRNRVAHVNSKGEVTDFDPQILNVFGAPGMALSRDGSTLYLGGNFDAINNGAVTSKGFVALDSTTGIATTLYNVTAGGGNGTVRRIKLLDDNTAIIVGQFDTVGAVSTDNIAQINLTTGQAFLDARFNITSVDSEIYDLVHDEENEIMYAAGPFVSTVTSKISGAIARDRVFKFDIRDDGIEREHVTGFEATFNNEVRGLHLHGGYLYVFGLFTQINSVAMSYAVRLDKDSAELDTVWAPAPNGIVHGIYVLESHVYTAGSFTNIGGQALDYLARLSLTDGSADASWAPDPNFAVLSLTFGGGRLHATGTFTTFKAGAVAQSGTALFGDPAVLSPIGQYRLELVVDFDESNPINNVVWRVYRGNNPVSGALIYEGDPVIESKIERDGQHWPGPTLHLPDPNNNYAIEAVLTRLDSSTDIIGSYIANSVNEAVYIVSDGVYKGYAFDSATAFAAPGVVDASGTYTITCNTLPSTPPSAANGTVFFRIYCIMDSANGSADQLTIDWGGAATDVLNFTPRQYYSNRIYSNDNSTGFTLDIDFDDTATPYNVGNAVSVGAPGSYNWVNPDQLQIERQVRIGGTQTGPQTIRYIVDWTNMPSTLTNAGYDHVIANQGPGAFEYRYRFRWREFRRDGIEDERGPVEVTSAWSAWSSYV